MVLFSSPTRVRFESGGEGVSSYTIIACAHFTPTTSPNLLRFGGRRALLHVPHGAQLITFNFKLSNSRLVVSPQIGYLRRMCSAQFL
jgi:hypothetical protein